jgi:hypothetical protein
MQVRGRRPCALSFGIRSITKIEECWRYIKGNERLTYIVDIFEGIHEERPCSEYPAEVANASEEDGDGHCDCDCRQTGIVVHNYTL